MVLLWDQHNSVLGRASTLPIVKTGFEQSLYFERYRPEQKVSGHIVYLCEEFSDMEMSLAAVAALLEDRIAYDKVMKKQGKKARFRPFFWLADEWLNVSENVPAVLPLMTRIVAEGRKYLMFAATSGHSFSAECIGGTKVKHNCSTQFAFRTAPLQAELIGFEQKVYREQFLTIISREFGQLQTILTEDHDPSAGWCLLQAKVMPFPVLVKIPEVKELDMVWVLQQVAAMRGYQAQVFFEPFPETLPDEKQAETPEAASGLAGNDFEALPSLPPLPPRTGYFREEGEKSVQKQQKQQVIVQEPLREPLLTVSQRFPHIDRKVLEDIYFHYKIKRKPRRDLPDAISKGGKFYQQVIAPVCTAIDEVLDEMAQARKEN